MISFLRHWLTRAFTFPLARWLAAGVAFMVLNIGLLFILVDLLGVRVIFATLIAAEIGTVLRYLVNDRWVFGHRQPTWRRLLQYQVANAVAFTVWWSTTNLMNFWGVYYLLAAVLAAGCSIGFSLVSNFYWIWHKRTRPSSE